MRALRDLPRLLPSAIAVCAVLLAIYTVVAQLRVLSVEYVREDGRQLTYHNRVISGEAEAPYQYRILSEEVVQGFLHTARWLNLPDATGLAFIAARIVQNTVLFVVASLYYRRLGLSASGALVGISLLAWGMTQSLYDSNLAFDTYSDVIFYLTAGVLILSGRDWWIPLVMVFAAMNRESSGLIPIMLFGARWRPRAALREQRSALGPALAAVAAYATVFIALRGYYGLRPLYVAYGHTMGIDMLSYNLGRIVTWLQALGTLGILPGIAIIGYSRWPEALRRFGWTIIPAWLIIHVFTAVLAETRLLLVPQALIFIPGALCSVTVRLSPPEAT